MSKKADIETRLREQLQPAHLEVVDETRNHNVPEDAESHFKIVVVSERFDGKPLVARHRLVNELFSDEIASGSIHALALHTMTPEEWQTRGGEAPQSPPCHGGGKKS